MNAKGIPTIAWVLACLLGLAAFFISSGKQDLTAQPETTSSSPSGISAFVELLRKSGMSVSSDQEAQPDLRPNDVAVAFQVEPKESNSLFGTESPESKFETFFWDYVKHGGTGILLPLNRNYLQASRSVVAATPSPVHDDFTGASYGVSIVDPSASTDNDVFTTTEGIDSTTGITLWSSRSGPFLKIYRVGKGTVLIALDAIGMTNRFIDKADNAKAFASLFSILTHGNKRLVFTEASFGNIRETGLLQTIGSWANAAWQQFLLLGFVVILTLGKRFGLPEEQRSAQRGSRELVDAIADTYERARSVRFALTSAFEGFDSDLRRVLKLPMDASRKERDRLIPSDLQIALARLESAKEIENVSQEAAVGIIRAAQREMDTFVGASRTKLRRKAKLKR